MVDDFPKTAQGQAIPANNTDINHDKSGITYPNLHRRIDDEATPLHPGEVVPDRYTLSVGGVNSYRTTDHITHDEESSDSEIP